MNWLRWIRICNHHDLHRFAPLFADNERIGYVRVDRLESVVGDAIACEQSAAAGQTLQLRGATPDERTEQLAELARTLSGDKQIRPLTNEPFPILSSRAGSCFATIDRALVAYLGVHARGVHLNGFTRLDERCFMWIAERSRSKATYPGMLDNMVAGGQPHGLGLRANLLKECSEEAGIPLDLARHARPTGAVSYVYEDSGGLKPDTMFCFDLELPQDFVPMPVDGEVETFHLLPIDEVAALVRDTDRFKFNCNLVILDFLVRHGWLCADESGYEQIVRGLRQALPD